MSAQVIPTRMSTFVHPWLRSGLQGAPSRRCSYEHLRMSIFAKNWQRSALNQASCEVDHRAEPMSAFARNRLAGGFARAETQVHHVSQNVGGNDALHR